MQPTPISYTTSAPSAAEIAAALGARRVGPGRWMARCPAHDDRTPSLSITDKGGKVLLYDFGGCSQRDVISALRARGLWPERGPMPAPQRRAWAQARRRGEEIARDAFAWHHAILAELDRRKEAAIDFDAGRIDDEALEAAAREHWRLTSLDARGVVDAFLEARRERPAETARLLRTGRAWLMRCERFAREVVEELARRAGAA